MAAVAHSPTDWRQDFVDALASSGRAGWELAHELRLRNMPSRLYRYRSVNKYSVQALQRGSVWLSRASLFNDLQDTTLTVDAGRFVEKSLQEMAAEGTLPTETIAAMALPGVNSAIEAMEAALAAEVEKEQGAEIAAKVKGFFTRFAAMQSKEMSTKVSAFMQAHTKVGCFCEAHDIPAMWANYASEHAGFCIEYPIDALPRDSLQLRWLTPVIYTDKTFNLTELIERLGPTPLNPYVAVLCSIHKGPSWAYEREWRIVDVTGDDIDGREMVMPTPSKLFLGHRMKKEDRDTILAIVAALKIPVFEMHPRHDAFGFEARPV